MKCYSLIFHFEKYTLKRSNLKILLTVKHKPKFYAINLCCSNRKYIFKRNRWKIYTFRDSFIPKCFPSCKIENIDSTSNSCRITFPFCFLKKDLNRLKNENYIHFIFSVFFRALRKFSENLLPNKMTFRYFACCSVCLSNLYSPQNHQNILKIFYLNH